MNESQNDYIFKDNILNYVKESRHKGIYVVWFYLHEILQHTKLINILKYQKSGCFRGTGELYWKGYKRTFWDKGNVMYLNCIQVPKFT